jgi:hypothetical protein
MDGEAARQKAREMKAEALGILDSPRLALSHVLDIICVLVLDNEFRSCGQMGGDPEIPILG